MANDVGEGVGPGEGASAIVSGPGEGTSTIVSVQEGEKAVVWLDEAIDEVVELREAYESGGHILYSLAQVTQILRELEGELRERREDVASSLEELREKVKSRSSRRAALASPELVEVLLKIEDELRKAEHPATATSFDGREVAHLLTKIDIMRDGA